MNLPSEILISTISIDPEDAREEENSQMHYAERLFATSEREEKKQVTNLPTAIWIFWVCFSDKTSRYTTHKGYLQHREETKAGQKQTYRL